MHKHGRPDLWILPIKNGQPFGCPYLSIVTGPHRDQHFQHEPVVLDGGGDGAAVFLSSVADTLQAETVIGRILLGRCGQAVPEIRMEGTVILHLQQQELLLGAEDQTDDPLRRIKNLPTNKCLGPVASLIHPSKHSKN